MAFRVKHIDHVELLVPDIRKTEAWYQKVLGLKRVHAWDPEPIMIGAGKTKLALFTSSRPKERKASKGTHRVGFGYLRVAFRTGPKGFEKAQRRLKRLRDLRVGAANRVAVVQGSVEARRVEKR